MAATSGVRLSTQNPKSDGAEKTGIGRGVNTSAPVATADAVPRYKPLIDTHGALVTGSHRSGTTWVGKMLATAPKVAYIHEPLKPGWTLPYTFTRAETWFQHIGEHNGLAWEAPVMKTVRFDYSWSHTYREKPGFKQALRATDRWLRWNSRKVRGFKPLFKDPISIFATPWLADRFGLKPVVMIRHPAAFVSSIKLKKWVFDFTHWTRQTEMMQTWLLPFRDELLAKCERNDDIVDQAILQWRIFHHVIDLFRISRPDWHYVRHEDLSLNPVDGFKSMFKYCGFDWTPASEKTIRESSDEGNLKDAAAVGKSTHYVQLDSVQNIKNWKKRLSADEILRIRQRTEDISSQFYSDQDWE